MIDKIPVWRALQESTTTVNKFVKLTSDPNQKPNGTQSKGIFLASTNTTNTNQSRPRPNQAPAQRQFPCPIECAQESLHPWGSLAFYEVFKAKDLPIERDLVRQARVCINCLKFNNHTSMRPCKALPGFNCKAAHHTLMCPKGQNGHVLLTDLE